MEIQEKAAALFHATFGGAPAAQARAPGRIEFIGNHTDYNGGTVIGASIDRTIAVAARLRADGGFVFASEGLGAPWSVRGRPLARQTGGGAWTNYPLGVILALEARGMPVVSGLELAVASDLPGGAGLSSSAALELASALAIGALQGWSLPATELAKACREAENKFVGVPCGILDQGVSAVGRRDHLVHIDCRGPAMSLLPLPAGVRFWILNTHAKHALVDSLYAARHAECMEALRLLRTRHGGLEWLADGTPQQVEAAADLLPSLLAKRARHVVEEVARVAEMREALGGGDLAGAGRLLCASHESSRTLFENSTAELDFLVDGLRRLPGVYGARLTGGGFGGAVLAMTGTEFRPAALEPLVAACAVRFASRPDVLACATADGAGLVK